MTEKLTCNFDRSAQEKTTYVFLDMHTVYARKHRLETTIVGYVPATTQQTDESGEPTEQKARLIYTFTKHIETEFYLPDQDVQT